MVRENEGESTKRARRIGKRPFSGVVCNVNETESGSGAREETCRLLICRAIMSYNVIHYIEFSKPQRFEALNAFVFSRSFHRTRHPGIKDFCTMWPVDLNDEQALRRQQLRMHRVEEQREKLEN